jgi:hypothetical protein
MRIKVQDSGNILNHLLKLPLNLLILGILTIYLQVYFCKKSPGQIRFHKLKMVQNFT